MGMDGESLALVWAGGAADLKAAANRGARLLALMAGLDRVELLLDALAESPAGAEAMAARDRWGGDAQTGGWEPSSALTSRLARVDRDLRVLRADAAVVQGDLEEATMNWARERQDAETTLMAYRDRARELKARLRQMEDAGPGSPCPTCGKVLDEHYDAVAAQLREEWESVVQDGQWWKRRREQLELKPPTLQDLESRSLRFQATIREAAERAEQLRAELGARPGTGGAWERRRRSEPPPRLVEQMAGIGDAGRAVETLTAVAREILMAARVGLLSSTSKIMNRLSGGRLVGLDAPEGEHGPLVPQPVGGAPGREDLAVALVASQIALARSLARLGMPLESLLVGTPFSAMEEEDQIRGVALLRRLTRRFPQILVLPSAGVVDASPESFDAVWEFRPAPERGLPALRPLPVGVGTVRVGAPTSSV